jgi:hypothetical protein
MVVQNGVMSESNPWVPLNYLTWNTHVSLTVTNEVWLWIRRTFPRIHVIFLQEVRDVAELRRVLGKEWEVRGTSSTFIAFRTDRFEDVDMSVIDITYGSKWKRARVTITAYDNRSRRRVHLGSIHTDPLGLGFVKAKFSSRRRHIRQTKAWAEWAKGKVRKNDQSVITIGGDVNERMDSRITGRLAPKTALAQFRRAGLTAAHVVTSQKNRVRLDDVFFHPTKYIQVTQRRQDRPPVSVDRGFDHDMVWLGTRVRRA